MTARLSTGLDVLDRKLDGGLPAGRIVVLTASPASQSELLLQKFATARRCLYLTAERWPSSIEETVPNPHQNGQELTIHSVDPDDPLPDAARLIHGCPDESTVIVDPINIFEEQPAGAYRAFVNELKDHVVETNKLPIFHALEGRDVPAQRDRTEYLADTVLDLHTAFRGGTIQNSLRIPKFRGGTALDAAIDLKLAQDVTIDVTRKIA